MGLKEELITDWTGKTIEYQGDRIYIVREIEYKEQKYLCGVVEETVEGERTCRNMLFIQSKRFCLCKCR